MRRRRGSSTTSANLIESNVPITSADHLYSFFPRIFFGSGGKEKSDEVSKKVKHYHYSKGYCIGAHYKRAREMASDRIVPRVCMLEETNPFDLFSRISASTAISSQSYSHVLSYPDDQMGIPDLLKSERAYANHYEKLREKRLISKRSSQNGSDKTKSKGKDGNDVAESQTLGVDKERKKRVRYEDEDEEEIEKKDKQKRKSVRMEKAELEQSLKEEEEERLKGGDKHDTRGNNDDEEEISFRKLSSKKAKRNKLADDDGAGDGNASGSEDGGNDDDDELDNEEDNEDDDINNIPRKTRLDRSQSIGTEGDDYENAYNQSDEEEFVHEDDNYDDDGGHDDD